jgi:hypothetical protein
MQESFVDKVRLPAQLLKDGNFTGMMEWEARHTIAQKRSPRRLAKGEFILTNEWLSNSKSVEEAFNLRPGYVVCSLPVSPDVMFGKIFQPGVFVSVKGTFNVSTTKTPQLEPRDIIQCVQARAIDGSFDAAGDKPRVVKTIEIIVKKEQSLQLKAIGLALQPTKSFSIEIVGQPERPMEDCVIEPDVLKLIASKATPKIDDTAPKPLGPAPLPAGL